MSIIKDLFIEAYDELMADAEESGLPIDEDKICQQADVRMRDKFADMCDEAKEKAKYKDL